MGLLITDIKFGHGTEIKFPLLMQDLYSSMKPHLILSHPGWAPITGINLQPFSFNTYTEANLDK